jgi:hypothetical protein
MLSTLEGLKEKLALLATPKQLEIIQRTVVSLSADLDKLAEKKQKEAADPGIQIHETKVRLIKVMQTRTIGK